MIPVLLIRVGLPALAVPVIAGSLLVAAVLMVPLVVLEGAKDAPRD